MLGLETGRRVHLLKPSNKRFSEHFGKACVLVMLVVAMAQLIYLKIDCESDEIDNTEYDGFVGGYSCVNQYFTTLTAFFLWFVLIGMVFAALLGPLQLCGHKVYRYISSYAVVSHYMRSSEHVTLVAHRNPEQVFLADGGHFDNSAMLVRQSPCSALL